MENMNDSYCFYFSLEFAIGDTGERCCRSEHIEDSYVVSSTICYPWPIQLSQYKSKQAACAWLLNAMADDFVIDFF